MGIILFILMSTVRDRMVARSDDNSATAGQSAISEFRGPYGIDHQHRDCQWAYAAWNRG
jgi:hypothetical protein